MENIKTVSSNEEFSSLCEQLKGSILRSKVPVLFKQGAKNWNVMKWEPQSLIEQLKCDPIVTVRFYPKNTNDKQFRQVPFETQCFHVECKLSIFLNWLSKDDNKSKLNEKYNKSKYWGYCDYVHFETVFDHIQPPNVKKMMNNLMPFNQIAFENDSIEKKDDNYQISCLPTLWIGSKNANSVCHYDSYGVNIVCQVYGTKQWMLWPPNMTKYLKPTRLPYEESTILSKIDILKNEQLCSCAVNIMLEKGDILFIPKHWWHFVESKSDITISVNQWIDDKMTDKMDKWNEYMTRYLLTSMKFVHGHCNDLKTISKWLNPKEQLLDPQKCLQSIGLLVHNELKHENETETKQEKEISSNDLADAIIESLTDPQVINAIVENLKTKIVSKDHKPT